METDSDSAAWAQRITSGIARGDRGALAEFYGVWFGRCHGMARSLTRRDESFCLDVVQETMLKVVRSMRPLESPAELRAWMSRAVHTTALDMLRAEARRAVRESKHHAAREPAQPASPALDEQIAWVRARLAELPGPDGHFVRLKVAGDRTLSAAGAAAGISGHAAHGRIRRALNRLRSWAREWTDDR